MTARPRRNGKGKPKTEAQRKATHKKKYGKKSKLPKRKHKRRK